MPINQSTIALEDPTTFTCPFCLGTFVVSPETPVAVHSFPPCPTFIEMELNAFLKKARQMGAEIVPEGRKT